MFQIHVLLTTLNAKYIHASLALRYLAAYCRELGSITIKEYTINQELLPVLSDIYRQKPDVLGLACYIWNIEMSLELASLVKKVLPSCYIVLGGPEVSYDAKEVLNQYRFVDFVAQGEGEEILYHFLSALESGEPVTGIPGLACRTEAGICLNGGPQVVSNLNSIPFPYTAEDIDQMKDKIVYYESSRGCPFGCRYCLSSTTRGVRFLSLSRVLADLQFFIDREVRQVKFVDRTFNIQPEHYLAIFEFLAAKKTTTNFHFEITADLLTDQVLEFLQTVPKGRFQFEIGVQSTYEPTLEAVGRKNDWAKLTKNVKRINSFHNIHLHLDLIAGLPYEGFERFGESFNAVYELQPDMLQLGFLKLLKGSGIRQDAEQHGYVFTDHAPYEVLGNLYLSYGELRRLKIIEEVLNLYYNSNRFQYSLTWLIARYDSAFSFYTALADFWEAKDLYLASHSAKSLYRYLEDFCRLHHSDVLSVCREILKFDALLSGMEPDHLPWNGEQWQAEKNAFWRNEALVRSYLLNFQFINWRALKKRYALEVFAVDILALSKDKPARKRIVVLLDRLTKEVYKIKEEDFWQVDN